MEENRRKTERAGELREHFSATVSSAAFWAIAFLWNVVFRAIVNISSARTGETPDDGSADVHWGLEHIGITVEDMDAELERLAAMGATLKEGPIDVPDGPIIAFIAAPDDTRIELLQVVR